MSDAGDSRRFEPRPRSDTDRRSRTDAQNVRDELQRIQQRCESVIKAGRESFAEGAPHYDVASMVVIRLAALLERSEFAALAERLTPDEVTAIKATRIIAAHAGYVGMNDDLFWAAVTVRIPEIVTRLLDSASP
ncbi:MULTISPECIES: antitoxin [Microcella]|uniref:antitoxin n=1 Tax=Microcella TaxID=337004 RepID=UPI001C54C083|nr:MULTISPECIES: antitoxin [Microcella]